MICYLMNLVCDNTSHVTMFSHADFGDLLEIHHART